MPRPNKSSRFDSNLYSDITWKPRNGDQVVSSLGHVVKFLVPGRRDIFLRAIEERRKHEKKQAALTPRERTALDGFDDAA